jgi:hypothetical protein
MHRTAHTDLFNLQTTQTHPVKSRAALILNGYELGHEFLAFWTFTFKKTLPLDVARKFWSLALTHLRKQFGRRLIGLRAFELHPMGHGLHVHMVTPEYIRLEHVRACLAKIRGQPFGTGPATKASSAASASCIASRNSPSLPAARRANSPAATILAFRSRLYTMVQFHPVSA